jgi:hypothetical protein
VIEVQAELEAAETRSTWDDDVKDLAASPRRAQRTLTVIVLVVGAIVSVAVIAVVQVETRRRTMFLAVPLAALLAWMAGRLMARRSVGRSVALGLTAGAVGVAADWLSGMWYLRDFLRFFGPDVTIMDVAKNPHGEWRFLVDRVWTFKEYLMWGSAALVAAVMTWPAHVAVVAPDATDTIQDQASPSDEPVAEETSSGGGHTDDQD